MNSTIIQFQNQIKDIDLKIDEVKKMSTDPDMAELAADEIKNLELQKKALEDSVTSMTQDYSSKPDDITNMDSSNAILEIRGGAGGDEAKLFAEDLMRMYVGFAAIKKIKMEPLDDGIVKFFGKNSYGLFKYESGVHRVQRVPVTESSGRIHTSTASVAVLPEVKPTQVEIREEDLEWKFTRAGGKGGQNVNKVNTAVLLTHNPSGIVVNCRQERSQQQNRILALDLLRAQLWEKEEEDRLSKIKGERQAAIGRNMRAEKIRTYNYPENRITDHRIPKTWHNMDKIIEGDLQKIIDAVDEHFTEIKSATSQS